MTTELWITIGIALIGWTWAIAQFLYKRRWQKKDMIATRRYDAYSQYMRKCEEINENMRKDPQAIYGITNDFISKILNGNPEEIDAALIKFNQHILDYIQRSCSSLFIVNQEINTLLLIASEDLLKKLNEQKKLTTDFNNELQNCLNKINVKDGNSFKILETMGQHDRWSRFKTLNEEIISLMRKEIDIE